MLQDAQSVLRRGRALLEEERNHEHPQRGTPQDASPESSLPVMTLWCGAIQCTANRLPALALDYLAEFVPISHQAPRIAEILFDGLMVGLRCSPSQVGRLWGRFSTFLLKFVEGMTARSPDSTLSRALVYELELLILKNSDLASPLTLSFSMGLHLHLENPVAIRPPPSIDRLLLVIHREGEPLLTIYRGLLGPLTRADALALALTHAGFRFVLKRSLPTLLRSRPWGHHISLLVKGSTEQAVSAGSLIPTLHRYSWRRPRSSAKLLPFHCLAALTREESINPSHGRSSRPTQIDFPFVRPEPFRGLRTATPSISP